MISYLSLPPSPFHRSHLPIGPGRAALATTTAARDHRTGWPALHQRLYTRRPCCLPVSLYAAARRPEEIREANWSSCRFSISGRFVRTAARLDLSFLARVCSTFLHGFLELPPLRCSSFPRDNCRLGKKSSSEDRCFSFYEHFISMDHTALQIGFLLRGRKANVKKTKAVQREAHESQICSLAPLVRSVLRLAGANSCRQSCA